MNVQKNNYQNNNINYSQQITNTNPQQQTPQKMQRQDVIQNNERADFFIFLNQKNNMNLIKIILFYSKYSKLCDDFLKALHPYYKQLITFICVDNSSIRKRLMTSKYKLQVVPSVFMLFENGKVNVHSGQELIQLVDFFNKNMETYMVIKTQQTQKTQIVSHQEQSNLNQTRLIQTDDNSSKITPLNFNIRKEKNHEMNNSLENELEDSLSDSMQSRHISLMRENQELSRINNTKNSKTNKEVTHLPRVKEPIPYEFNKKVEIGMSSKRLVPRGKKEHEKMALTSVKFIEGNRLDTVQEEDDDDDEDDNEIDINIEDAEILNDDIDELMNSEEDPTIDPIIKKDNKKSIKEIAADMQQVRGDPDSKKYPS